jgi:NAD(P)-dependent dehydrogenase (short-subunit alcohol dehydrogenase family)
MLKEEDIERMVKETVEKWGRVDYAVNAAGTSFLAKLALHMENGRGGRLMRNRGNRQQRPLDFNFFGAVRFDQ